MEPTDPTSPILTWSGIAAPATITLAVVFLLAFFALAVLSIQLNVLQHHLRSIRIHVRESRDWFRRNAADQRAADYNTLVHKPHLLTRHFDYLERQSTVTVQDVRAAKDNDPEIIDALHSLLSYYDGLARGIELNVLSERVVKAAHHDNMVRTFRIFRPYIEHHRLQAIPEAWIHLDQLITKWENAPAQPPELASQQPARRAA